MGHILGKVHHCNLPNSEDYEAESVWRCACGKYYSLVKDPMYPDKEFNAWMPFTGYYNHATTGYVIYAE